MAENYYPISLSEEQSSFSVVNTGTAPSPCVLTLIPRVNQVAITISGLSREPIVITGITANDVIVIDGENREFTINGNLAWDKFSGWSFPRIEPGTNTITITNAYMMAIEIAYNARYI